MKTYKITIPALSQVVEGKTKKDAIATFWDNFDTYNGGWPDTEDLLVKEIDEGEDESLMSLP